jgi:hypothetical protein
MSEQMEKCKYFETCDCPLCPLGSDKPVWYPGESVCRREGIPDWVKRQRKIANKVTKRGFWTKAMFEHDCQIRAGTEGIDPETYSKDIPKAVENWKLEHPAYTAEERSKMAEFGRGKIGNILGQHEKKVH